MTLWWEPVMMEMPARKKRPAWRGFAKAVPSWIVMTGLPALRSIAVKFRAVSIPSAKVHRHAMTVMLARPTRVNRMGHAFTRTWVADAMMGTPVPLTTIAKKGPVLRELPRSVMTKTHVRWIIVRRMLVA